MVFLGFPILVMLAYSLIKVYQTKLTKDNLEQQNKFVENKIKEIENINVDFAGQTIFEKMEEGVTYFINPI